MESTADAAQYDGWVICLCADWCGVCRDWRSTFEQAAAAHPGVRFAWVDIEDEAEAMGDVDVETFPTLLVARRDQPLFFGPVLPSGNQFTRLLESLFQPGSRPTGVSNDVPGLFRRLTRVL